jgi:hypothetical protein
VRSVESEHVRHRLLGLERALDLSGRDVDDQQCLAAFGGADDVRIVDPADVVGRAVLAEIDRLDGVAARQRNHAERLLRPDILPVVIGDDDRASVGRYRRFVRRGHDFHVPIRLHRLQIDQRDRIGLLIDGDDRAGEVDLAWCRLSERVRGGGREGQGHDEFAHAKSYRIQPAGCTEIRPRESRPIKYARCLTKGRRC